MAGGLEVSSVGSSSNINTYKYNTELPSLEGNYIEFTPAEKKAKEEALKNNVLGRLTNLSNKFDLAVQKRLFGEERLIILFDEKNKLSLGDIKNILKLDDGVINRENRPDGNPYSDSTILTKGSIGVPFSAIDESFVPHEEIASYLDYLHISKKGK